MNEAKTETKSNILYSVTIQVPYAGKRFNIVLIRQIINSFKWTGPTAGKPFGVRNWPAQDNISFLTQEGKIEINLILNTSYLISYWQIEGEEAIDKFIKEKLIACLGHVKDMDTDKAEASKRKI